MFKVTRKNLRIHRETLRTLSSRDLSIPRGGKDTDPTLPSDPTYCNSCEDSCQCGGGGGGGGGGTIITVNTIDPPCTLITF